MSKNALLHAKNPNAVWSEVQCDADGHLLVSSPGGGDAVSLPSSADAGNTTSANLAIGDTFTGTGVDVTPYGTISVAVQSSHNSAVGGLVFQGSFNNSTWFDMEGYSYVANGIKIYSMAPAGRYFRVVYTNGASATTSLNIRTTLTQAYTKPSSQRVGDIITAENDAELVKSVLAAKKPDGTFTDIDCTAGGNLKVSLEESDSGAIVAVKSPGVVVGVELIRPADTTAYAAKDVVSNSTSAPTVLTFANFARINNGAGLIVKARLMTDQITNVSLFRLHLFHTAPTAINDNSPYLLLYANAANRIGTIDFPAMATEDGISSTAASAMRPNPDGSYACPNLYYQAASASRAIYGILETVSAFTPASGQKFYVELSAIND